MQKDSTLFCLPLLTLLAFASIETNTMALGLPDVPPAVQKTIGANSSERTVSNIDRVVDDGDVTYKVETTSKDGEEWDLTVAEDGTLDSIDVAPADVPAAVQTAIKIQVGDGSLEGVEKQFDDGEATYKAGIITETGDERDYTFAEDGTLESKEVSLAELPAAVQAAINAQVGQNELEGIDKTFDDDDVHYEASMKTPTGQERDFSISETGSLLSQEVSLKDLPDAAQTAITTQVGNGKLDGIDKTFRGVKVRYEATMTTADGQERDFRVTDDGTLLSKEVGLGELPEVVQTAINKQVGDGKLEEIDESFRPAKGTVAYEATKSTSDGLERDFSIGQDGALLSRQVSFEETPPAVQSTITQTVGNGKVLRVDQVFWPKRSPYEVEAQKDGKPIDFIVGPKGKLLSAES
jgi:uncharacterized membrane protein YkoI